MNADVHARLSYIPPSLYPETQRRVRRSLERWKDRIYAVRVFLTDDDGPERMDGTRCRIVLEPQRGGTIVATGRGLSAEAALSDALQCTRENLRRINGRRFSRGRARIARRSLGESAA